MHAFSRNPMLLDEFSYELPRELIAKKPLATRSASRLMVVHRSSGRRVHSAFSKLHEHLCKGDLLVVNRSRVIPARLFLKRESGGSVEVLYVRKTGRAKFEALLRPLRRLRTGEILHGREGVFSLRLSRRTGSGFEIEIISGGDVEAVLEKFGHVPLPPYIDRPDSAEDRARYQTLFAEEAGSVAAPTAGLHFDKAMMGKLERKGIGIASVVLHVGPGTFLPLRKERVEENKLHAETFAVDAQTVRSIVEAKQQGRRIVAVGTTVARVLETCGREGFLQAPAREGGCEGETSLFIYPGYRFGVVDALVTNFHLPRSSLLLLVCAFLGRERTLACYRDAVKKCYRFYSYGDAMLIL